MKAVRLLASAAEDLALEMPTSLGGPRIENKKSLLAKFRAYRQFVTITLVLLYVLAIVVAVATVALALKGGSSLPKGLIPYIGGAAFVALLEFARRLTKDWMLMTLPLVVAEHASNDQLQEFIRTLLIAVTKPETPTEKPK
jgi:hypothetical protein